MQVQKGKYNFNKNRRLIINILFLTLLDFSDIEEQGIYTDLLREFLRRGHNLSIISPVEKKKNISTHIIKKNSLKILKIKIGNIQKINLIEKGFSTLLLETKFKRGLKKYFNNIKFDLIIYTTPPITLVKAISFIKLRDNAKTYLLLKDIFPQNAIDLGMLNKKGIKGLIYKYFKAKEKKLYDCSDYIGCMSKANIAFLLNNNELSTRKVELCPNTIEPKDMSISKVEKNKIRSKYIIPLNKTVFIYGGNLGKPQDIDFIIKCLKKNEYNNNSYILIIGFGTEYHKLNNYFEINKPKNSKLINYLPKIEFELLVSSCDVGLIFLDSHFTIPNFPSRLLSYMQSSLPVIAATDVNTDVGRIIELGEFGFWCESNDENNFNELIIKMCNKNNINEMGKNARLYLEQNYTSKHSYNIIMNHFKIKEEKNGI